jgi:hypothetical protein
VHIPEKRSCKLNQVTYCVRRYKKYHQENAEAYESQNGYCDTGSGVDQSGLQTFHCPKYVLMVSSIQFFLPFHVRLGSLRIGLLHFEVEHSFPQNYHIRVHPTYKQVQRLM